MIILSLKCDNIFMFKDFFIDFTYSRKLSHPLSEKDYLFPGSRINVRKRMLILGGNASGKTTFGKILCAISNFIIGRTLVDEKLHLQKAIYALKKESSFEIEFVMEDIAYRLKAVFNSKELLRETLSVVKIHKSYNIKNLRRLLDTTADKFFYKKEGRSLRSNGELKPFFSKVLTNPSNKNIFEHISKNMGFHYMFSNFAEQSSESKINIPVKMFNDILPNIDNSVEKVLPITTSDKKIKTNSYLISFKNGTNITIPDGDLMASNKDRLSHGTYEALKFLNIINEIKYRIKDIIFVDEKLAHLHVELEAYLIMKSFQLNRSSQIFFTSHNSELLDLNLPNNSFILFKRNENGYNEMVYVSDKVKKNDRRIRYLYENDFFGVLPDYSILDKYFGDIS